MLRLRKTNKEALVLPPEFRFLEVADTEGKVAKVFYQDDAGFIHAITSTDPEAARYAKMFGVEWCELVTLPNQK